MVEIIDLDSADELIVLSSSDEALSVSRRNDAVENLKSKPEFSRFCHIFTLDCAYGKAACTQLTFEITYTCDLIHLQRWLSALPKGPVGFDTEGQGILCQLSSFATNKVLLFQFPATRDKDYLRACARVLDSVMNSEEYMKIGVASIDDSFKLRDAFGIQSKNVFELKHLAYDLVITAESKDIKRKGLLGLRHGTLLIQDDEDVSSENVHLGLKRMFQEALQVSFDKLAKCQFNYLGPSHYSRRAWARYPLSFEDISYASKDAIMASMIFNSMITKYSDGEFAIIQSAASKEFYKRLNRSKARKHEHRTRSQQNHFRRKARNNLTTDRTSRSLPLILKARDQIASHKLSRVPIEDSNPRPSAIAKSANLNHKLIPLATDLDPGNSLSWKREFQSELPCQTENCVQNSPDRTSRQRPRPDASTEGSSFGFRLHSLRTQSTMAPHKAHKIFSLTQGTDKSRSQSTHEPVRRSTPHMNSFSASRRILPGRLMRRT